jgi:hypothetical protein
MKSTLCEILSVGRLFGMGALPVDNGALAIKAPHFYCWVRTEMHIGIHVGLLWNCSDADR